MYKKTYPVLLLKRSVKKYPVIIAVTLITLMAVALTGYAVFSQSRSSEDVQKVRIGIVGDIHDTYLGLGVYALQNLDSSRFSVEFSEMESEEAEKALKAREISGYIHIPDDFIKGVIKGKNTPATYYIRKGAVNFGSIIISEITGTVSNLVTESQTAIYSMQDIARDYGKRSDLSRKTKTLNLMYIDFILNRSNIFDVQTTGISDSLSPGGYYLCAMLTFLLMLWGISCSSILARRSDALSRMLASRGMSAGVQVMSEYISYLVITMLTLLIFAIAAVLILDGRSFGIAELESIGSADAVMFVIKLTPMVMMITAMHTAICEAIPGITGAILMQFLVAVGLGYVSGCFYPTYFFPEAVQKIALWLPCGAGFSYVRKILGEGQIMTDMAVCMAYFLAFLALTASVRRFKAGGDGA